MLSGMHLCGEGLWEQGLLAMQVPRFLKDRVTFIAGKPCSHSHLATGLCVAGLVFE